MTAERVAWWWTLWAFLGMGLTACPSDRRDEEARDAPQLRLVAGPPLAVGARKELMAWLACPDSPTSNQDTACEQTGIARIEVATVDDAAVLGLGTLRLEGDAGKPEEKPFHVVIPLEAKGVGRTTLRLGVTDDTGTRRDTDVVIETRQVERVELRPRCDAALAEPPYLLPTGALVWFDFALYSGTERLAGEGFLPISAGPLSVGAPSTSAVFIRMPRTPGPVVVTSPVDPTLAVALEVYDAAAAPTGVTLQRAEKTPAGPHPVQFPEAKLDFEVHPLIKGRLACSGDVSVTLEITDRKVCSLFPLSQDPDGIRTHSPRDHRFSVYGLMEGTCGIGAGINNNPGRTDGRMELKFFTDLPRGAGSWRWEAPLPQGNDLRDISGTGTSNIWAVGEGGTLLRFDGTTWSPVPSGLVRGTAEGQARPFLRGVWTPEPGAAFAVGDRGLILHWNGAAWSRVESGTVEDLASVSGSSASDVWAVGARGTLLRWNGSAWAASPSGTAEALTAVWSAGPGRAWAVGRAGTLLRFDGSAWVPEAGADAEDLIHVSGTGPDDVWSASTSGSLFRRTEGVWRRVASGTEHFFQDVWVAAPNDIWGTTFREGLFHWNGEAWSHVPRDSTNAIWAFWGSAPGDLWGVGEAGHLERWDGARWTQVSVEPTFRVDLRTLWTSPSGELWATWAEQVFGGVPGVAPPGSILRRPVGGTWTPVPTGTTAAFHGLWGAADNDVWAVGTGGTIVHWDGAAWSQVASNTGLDLFAVWGSGPRDVWVAAANSTVLHWNGSRWDVNPLENTLGTTNPTFRAIWGAGPGDVWVVGTSSAFQPWVIWHHNGLFWSKQGPALRHGASLYGLWGNSSTDVWAVGDRGTVLHYDGSTWRQVRTGLDRTLWSVWGSRVPGDVWVAGFFDILHRRGSSWETVPPEAPFLTGLSGRSTGELWTYGWDGVLLRYVP
jgi:hypothetical protein